MRAVTQGILLLHRYLGIVFGLLIVVWCLSGFVMMYVSYPALQESERIAALPPMTWDNCCVLSPDAVAADAELTGFTVEMLGVRPVARLRSRTQGSVIVDLASGQRITTISAEDAARVAAGYGGVAGTFTVQRLAERDQWTVSGEFNQDRPLYKVALNDPAGSVVYVSSTSGQAVQKTTRHQRFWNWLGAVPHWLYFTALRTNALVWAQVINITALLGCVLTVAGIYIGLRHTIRARAHGAWSIYRGLKLWHHVPGLLFGAFAFTWLLSGLVSMNPWGFLAGSAHAEISISTDVRGFSQDDLRDALAVMAASPAMASALSVTGRLMGDDLYMITHGSSGERQRFDRNGRSAALSARDLLPLASRIGSAASPATFELMTEGDAYYFDHHSSPVPWPVYRAIAGGEDRTRYYVDAVSGDVLRIVTADQRWYRWLHAGLHRLDFTPGLRSRPLWDVAVWLLLGGVTLLCLTGAYLGFRRLRRGEAQK